MIQIDFENGQISETQNGTTVSHALESAEGFEIATKAWLRAGWDAKYVYSFAWMGRPVIQLPDDLMKIQEVIYAIAPDVIIETGVAHGGSLIFYASLCKAMEKGRIVGIDIEIRPHNRAAIEGHPLSSYITLLEGSSVAPEVVEQTRAQIKDGESTLIILDSNHSKAHVLAELDAYAPMVSVGSYIVATDGIMEIVAGGPRTEADWKENNPRQAALEWVQSHPDFAIVEPPFVFNEGVTRNRVSYWPDAFIQRVR